MKNIKYTLITLLFYVASSLQELYAKRKPPQPRGGFDDSTVVGGAIDNHIVILLTIAMFLGAWYLYKINQKKESPLD